MKFIKVAVSAVVKFVTNLIEKVIDMVSENSSANVEVAINSEGTLVKGEVANKGLVAIQGIMGVATACGLMWKGKFKEAAAIIGVASVSMGVTDHFTRSVRKSTKELHDKTVELQKHQLQLDHEYRMAKVSK